jgi:phosphatidate cytidylyltransferase
LLLAGLIFGTLFTSRPAFFVLVASAVLISLAEFYRALRARGEATADVLGIAAGALLLGGAYVRGPSALSFGIVMTLLATLLWYMLEPEGAIAGVAATMLGVVYIPFLAAHVVMMSRLAHGPALTIGYIGLVAFYDIGAYAFGVWRGRHPMAPSVSPKKSWEGAIGATAFIVVVAALAGPHIGPFTLRSAVLLALVTAVVAPLGDLAESLIKRDLDIKDMGNLLPGHGGVFDRIDSLLMVAPAAYWLMRTVVL